MKKLLYAFFAFVFALGALSITGCSGDFHDEELPTGLYLLGKAVASQTGGASGGWDPSNVTDADKSDAVNGTQLIWSNVSMVKGEFHFCQRKAGIGDWDGCGEVKNTANGGNWSIPSNGKYKIVYDVGTSTAEITSLATIFDDPVKVEAFPFLIGGIGSPVKLIKNGTNGNIYEATWTGANGGWGEDAGFIRCSLVTGTQDTADNPGDWSGFVVRYGSGEDDPQNKADWCTGGTGYGKLKDDYLCKAGAAGSTKELKLVKGGNFVIKGIEVGSTYKIKVDVTRGDPVITFTKQ